jgi:hypothetical protein
MVTDNRNDTANTYFDFAVSVFFFSQILSAGYLSLQNYHALKYEFKFPGPNKVSGSKVSLIILRNVLH